MQRFGLLIARWLLLGFIVVFLMTACGNENTPPREQWLPEPSQPVYPQGC